MRNSLKTPVLLLSPLLALWACGEKDTVSTDAVAEAQADAPGFRDAIPAPLDPRPFAVPEVSTSTLSNGVSLEVVENHEVPLVTVRVELAAGSWTDSPELPGLASVTLDMLNEGAGDYDAAGLSGELKQIAGSLSASASLDYAAIELSVLEKNLDRGLELLALLLTQPTFPEAEWEIVQKRRLADLAAARNNPNQIASRVFDNLLYGDLYDGMLRTEAGYEAMSPDAFRDWWGVHGVPAQARISVGGDTTLEDIKPRLDAALADWQGGDALSAERPTADSLPELDSATLYFVDKPGAAQSVVRMGTFTLTQTDADYPAFVLANQAVGGFFSARINMNLREDKGWTYGARSSIYTNYLPSLFQVSTGVITAHTAESVAELYKEVDAAREARPLTQPELDAGRGYLLGTLPLRFENPGYLLGQRSRIARYSLSSDWIETWPERLRSVSVDEAQAAWNGAIASDKLVVLVVGDKAVVGEGLAALGRPIVELDADGEPLAQ